MSFLVLAVLVTLTATATVWLAETRAAVENDPDSTFWYTFAGLCVLAPMILIPALSNNFSSLLLLFLAGVSAIATHLFLRRRRAAARAAVALAALAATLGDAAGQHQGVLDEWACYLLDPEPASLYPAMTDIQSPETAALVRTMAAAEQLVPSSALTSDGVAAYQRAVTSLVRALETAEDAAHRNSGT